MKVARVSFLGVLVGVLLLTIFLTLHTQAASQVSPKTSINSLSPATSVHEKVVNADSIVHWRSDPDWNTPLTTAQQGVYTGDTVALACYTRGSPVPPNNNNPLWYWAEVISGHGQGSGWVNDHFLNTGTNQPNIPVNNVKPCPKYPYIWSNTGTANIRALPESDSTVLDPPALINEEQIGPFCWLDGGWAQGNYWTNRWFQVPIYDTFQAYHGYINASLVANQHTTPHCDASIQNPVTPVSMVTLAQGPVYSGNAYYYTITLSAFPKTATISVKCYDSASPSGFRPFTMTTDANGDASTQSKCYSGDDPDHWVIAGGITSNHVQWGSGSTSNPQPPTAAKVTLDKGPVYSRNAYGYAIVLSGFPANTSVSVECYDSVSPSGFLHFTMTTDGSGNASTQSKCYSGDGPDHWVIAGGITSNHVQWGSGSTSNPQPPTPTATPTPAVVPTPTATPTPTPVPPSVPPRTYKEQEGHRGANTFMNPHNASGMGQKIPAAAWVEVSCKVYAPEIQSVNPDGYWYRIASSPWNNVYYAAANTFMNGDPWNGPYSHNTDFNVPDC